MSLSLLALGASVGYLVFQKTKLEGMVEKVSAEYESERRVSNETTEGITFADIRQRVAKVKEPNGPPVYNERLDASDRNSIDAASARHDENVRAFDAGPMPARVEGVFLDALRYG